MAHKAIVVLAHQLGPQVAVNVSTCPTPVAGILGLAVLGSGAVITRTPTVGYQ